MEKGIILFAFGSRQYQLMAFNIALSIKYHNENLKVQLVTDGIEDNFKWAFDFIDTIKHEDLHDEKGKMQPAKAKTKLFDYTRFKNTLYLDVDGVVIKDLEPLLDHFIKDGRPYITQVIGQGTKDNDKYEYNIWASHEDIWKHYKLPEDATIPAIQSSFCFFTKKAKSIFKAVKENDENRLPEEDLNMTWGKRGTPRGIFPDELTYNVTCAQLGINPKSDVPVVFFGNKPVTDFSPINQNNYVVAIYGNKGLTHNSVLKYYDRMMRKFCTSFGIMHQYKSHHLMKGKHANGK